MKLVPRRQSSKKSRRCRVAGKVDTIAGSLQKGRGPQDTETTKNMQIN